MKKLIIPFIALALMASCGGTDKADNTKAREQEWMHSLTDSLTATRTEISDAQQRIDSLQAAIAEMLPQFNVINDSRLVEDYTLYKGVPRPNEVTKPTLTARILKNGQLEMIYSTPDVFRVAFTGKDADSVGALIAAEQSALKSVTYIDKGARRQISITPDQAKAIAATYRLASMRAEESRLQRRLPLLAEKIRILETRLAADTL